MNVLIACEFSGRVRDAFIARGHDAVSCDLLPTDAAGPHIQGDVLAVLDKGWDLIIAHPPCTYLSHAGIRWFNEERYGDKARERVQLRTDAHDFFMALYNAPAPRVCVENPIGYMNGHFRKPDQIVHPYYFGDPHVKTTCLWLRGLPKLVYPAGIPKPEPTIVQVRRPGKWAKGGEIKRRYSTEMAPTRGGHERSVTYQGIANAMAEQWGVGNLSVFDKMLDKKQGDFVQNLLF